MDLNGHQFRNQASEGELPVVSVITPTYNRVRLLRRAVSSVLRQTFSSWELIIVDDGSTDETADYVASIEDSRVRSVRQEHTGSIARTRNAGKQEALGDYVAFLDSDDQWVPEKLSVQLNALQASDGRWAYGRMVLVDEADREIDMRAGRWQAYEGWILRPLLAEGVTIASSAVMVERALLDHVGWFDESLECMEDFDLWLRLAAVSPVVLVPATIVHAGEHQDRTTRRFGSTAHQWKVRAFEKAAVRHRRHRAVRSLCLSGKARQLAMLADKQAAEGRRREAISAWLQAGYRGIRHPAWWKTVARLLVHPAGRRKTSRRKDGPVREAG